jgi:FKBP-type peptidyl-prolyl cis-trans isomerase (trigger factor)
MAKTYSVTVTKNDDATVSIQGTIPWDAFVAFEAKALARLGDHLELPGFRKGHVPEDIAKKHLGDELLLTDMAELAIQEFYPTILSEENIDAIGRPQLAITKLARDNELGFTIRTAIVPDITLPDYKKIAAAVPVSEPEAVTDADVDKVIENLRQMRAYGHVHQEGHDHKHDEPLPEVNDEFAKSFGEFKSVDDLKTKIRENVGKEKIVEANDKRRAAILDAIMSEVTISIPEVILESEREKLYSQIEMDVMRAGLSMEDYLKHANKTKGQVMEEFKPEAEKRAKMQLIINAIAKKEKVVASHEEVEKRAESLMKMYPGVEKSRAEAYSDMVITNEQVIDLLEKAK